MARDVLHQGNTAATIYLTPGHALGTISPVLEVRSSDRRRKAWWRHYGAART
jgi:hypothetical protein